jgi:hypothetical protein
MAGIQNLPKIVVSYLVQSESGITYSGVEVCKTLLFFRLVCIPVELLLKTVSVRPFIFRYVTTSERLILLNLLLVAFAKNC